MIVLPLRACRLQQIFARIHACFLLPESPGSFLLEVDAFKTGIVTFPVESQLLGKSRRHEIDQIESHREKVMYPEVAIALMGASFVAFTGAYWLVTLGTFLVGIGWAAANVAATAMIADQTETAVRGRAIGVNESFSGAVAVAMALVTGPIIEWSGLPMTGFVAVLVALPPLVMWCALQLGARAARNRAAA